MADLDYAPVQYDEDEEERLRNGGYAPAVPPPPEATAPAPAPSTGAPPVTSASPMPPVGSTADLENRGFQSHVAPPANPPAPRPAWKDYAPPAPHGFGKLGRALENLYHIGPEEAAERNYKNATAEYEAPLGEEKVGAEAEQKESQADLEREQAETLRRTGGVKPGVTPEETTIHDLMTGENGQPRLNPQTGKPYSYLEAYGAVQDKKAGARPQRPDTPEQQFIDEFQKTHPTATVAQAVAAYANATQKPERPQRQLAVIDGKVVELTPGMDATGAQSIGGEEKANVAGQAGQDALSYANDYMQGGKFTGAGDEALMEKYFELAKPSSGFRMTQAQIEMLQHARDLMGGFEAKAKHLFTPEAPYFSDTQRKQIVETMSRLENSKASEKGKGGGKTQDFTDNGKTYHIPADKVEAFKKDHPNAR